MAFSTLDEKLKGIREQPSLDYSWGFQEWNKKVEDENKYQSLSLVGAFTTNSQGKSKKSLH